MADEQKMIKQFTIFYPDMRATAQYPEARFDFRLPLDEPIDIDDRGRLIFTTVDGVKIKVYERKLLTTAEAIVPADPPKPTANASKQP